MGYKLFVFMGQRGSDFISCWFEFGVFFRLGGQNVVLVSLFGVLGGDKMLSFWFVPSNYCLVIVLGQHHNRQNNTKKGSNLFWCVPSCFI